jgi:nucleoside-diphosphate-sugar epimerase
MAEAQRIIWITGAAGFSGRHLIRFLRTLPESHPVVGLDLKPAAPDGLDVYRQVDLANLGALRQLAREYPPYRVIHLAGLLPPATEADLWLANVGGTLNLLQALAGAKDRKARVLTVGSAAEYLPSGARRITETAPAGGVTPYGRSKWAQSALALAFGAHAGLEVVVARTFNLIGPGVPLTLAPGALCAQFARGGQQSIKVGNLRSQRDFIDVRDAVSAYWTACENALPGTIYNVCTGKVRSIQTMVSLLSRLTGSHRPIKEDPTRFQRVDMDRVCGDNSELRRLGWEPSISFRQSLEDMLAML